MKIYIRNNRGACNVVITNCERLTSDVIICTTTRTELHEKTLPLFVEQDVLNSVKIDSDKITFTCFKQYVDGISL